MPPEYENVLFKISVGLTIIYNMEAAIKIKAMDYGYF